MVRHVRGGRWVCGLVAVLLPAAAAHAGPISWTYRAAIDGDGSLPNTRSWVEVPEPAGSFTAKSDGSPDAFTGARVHLNETQPAGPQPGPTTLSRKDTYYLTVHITDTASGESGDVRVSGSIGVDWEYRTDQTGVGYWDPHSETYHFGGGPNDRQLLVLGGNRYEVWGEGFTDQGYVVVAAAAANTPEPASLGIAIIGLASAGAVTARRRSRNCSRRTRHNG